MASGAAENERIQQILQMKGNGKYKEKCKKKEPKKKKYDDKSWIKSGTFGTRIFTMANLFKLWKRAEIKQNEIVGAVHNDNWVCCAAHSENGDRVKRKQRTWESQSEWDRDGRERESQKAVETWLARDRG